MDYISVCGPTGYGFSAIWVINKVLILAVLVINRVWFLHSSLELDRCFFFLEEATFSSLSIRPLKKKSFTMPSTTV